MPAVPVCAGWDAWAPKSEVPDPKSDVPVVPAAGAAPNGLEAPNAGCDADVEGAPPKEKVEVEPKGCCCCCGGAAAAPKAPVDVPAVCPKENWEDPVPGCEKGGEGGETLGNR